MGRPIGGAERQLSKFASGLTAVGIDVVIVTGRWSKADPEEPEQDGIPVRRLFTARGMLGIKGLRRFAQFVFLFSLAKYLIVRRQEYDLIHCHSAKPSALVVAYLGKKLRKPTLARPMASGSKWGDIDRISRQWGILGSRRMLRLFREIDRVIALNRDVANELVAIGVERSRIALIPNGVEVGNVSPKTTYALNHEFILTYVGRLHPQKGVDALLLAAAKISEHSARVKWRLNIVGDGPLLPFLRQQVNELHLNTRVSFLGQVADVYPVLRASDVFILPSRAEGMSNALLEAMSCGLPCIATRIAANMDIIQDGENGLLVYPDDVEDMTRKLILLAENPTTREKLGRRARQTVAENYSIESVVRRYVALYQEMLISALAAS